MGYRQFSTVRDEDDVDEEIVAPPAAKLAEVERRFEQASGYGTVEIADFMDGERATTISVTLKGGRVLALALTYDPSVMTEAATQDIQDRAKDNAFATAEFFCRLVTSWKMKGPLAGEVLQYDEYGNPKEDEQGRAIWAKEEIVPAGAVIPLDPEVLQYVPTFILIGIWREIGIEVNGDPKENRHSRRGSRRR